MGVAEAAILPQRFPDARDALRPITKNWRARIHAPCGQHYWRGAGPGPSSKVSTTSWSHEAAASAESVQADARRVAVKSTAENA